jgi:hypothetical protein
VKTNKQDCNIVASRILDLIAAMANITAHDSEEDVDPLLKEDLMRFEQ